MNAEAREQLRHTVLEVLASRHPNSVTRKGVLNRTAMDVDFEVALSDVVAALEFLKGLGHVDEVTDAFGTSGYWQATSQGVLTWERSKRPGSAGRD